MPSGSGASTSANYPAGSLVKTTTTDENYQPSDANAGKTEEFKDFEGQVVLKRQFTATETLSTYYVYDDYGNLRYVLPPAIHVSPLSLTAFNETDAAFDNFIYAYHYDDRKRVIEKKIPGKGWESMVYNTLNQVVLSQDEVQKNNGQWLFTKYDVQGRAVITGLYTDGSSLSALQAAVNNQGSKWESRISTGIGYSNNAFPQTIAYYHSISYYDDYNFPGNSFGNPTGAGQVSESRTKGLLTGSKVTTLGTGNMLLTVNYYDDEGRVLQTKSEHHLNGSDVVSNSYNFAGELISSTRIHTTNGANTTIATRYEYDHAGRKLATFENINDQGEVTLSHLAYNELGELKNKKLHNEMQSTDFAYNERGWLKNSSSSEFSMQLNYQDGSIPAWNGNVASQIYSNGTTNTFNYTYDKLNWLIQSSAGDNLGESMSYDLMGNIKSLTRDGFGTNNYHTYSGNKVMGISGFVNSGYAYDVNGNLKSDSQKGITNIDYNYLNLPQNFSGNQNISYSYNAAGDKLSKTTSAGTRNYVDGIEYNPGGVIDVIHTEEGLAQNNGGTYSYHYNLSDHLGNVRYTFDIYNGVVRRLQQDNYYAFGLRKSISPVGSPENKYLYNSKELQEEFGEYDYGSRFYDPVIGRWNVVDPMAESDRKTNPYAYAFNNPMRFIDPDGMFGIETVGGEAYRNYLTNSNSSSNEGSGEEPDPKKKKGYWSSFYSNLLKGDPFGNTGKTWERWLSEDSTFGTDMLNSISDTYWSIASLTNANTYIDYFNGQKAYWSSSADVRGKIDANYLNNFVENSATFAPLGYIASNASVVKAISTTKEFMAFEANGGYGVKAGNFELMYKNPRADGGMILSYKSSAGNKFRLDYHRIPNVGKSLHYHTNFFNLPLGTHRSLNPLNFGKPIK